jgi:hypothetical protein
MLIYVKVKGSEAVSAVRLIAQRLPSVGRMLNLEKPWTFQRTSQQGPVHLWNTWCVALTRNLP